MVQLVVLWALFNKFRDIKTEMNPALTSRGAGPDGSLIGAPGPNQGGSNLTLKGWPLTGGTTQMRFQPRLGRYLVAAAENILSILDIETQACLHSLEGHTKHVESVCWDPIGEFVVSVSEDSVRVWSIGLGSEGECVHELSCNRNEFHSCVFQRTYSSSGHQL